MDARSIETRRGLKIRVFEAGSGAPVVYMHGAGGLFDENPFLDALAEHYRVMAPEWPGYGESMGETEIEDMLDFTLHGWDVVDALGLDKPHVIGHSMGGMIAAEMACVAPRDLGKLVLVSPAGLWLEEHPIPDIYSMFPHELPPLIAHDQALALKLLTAGLDFEDPDVLQRFLVDNARRLGTAGKILFPIPNRRLAKRLYRLRAETCLVWGRQDKLIVPAYADRWKALIPQASLEWIDEAGHIVMYEKPEAFVAAVTKFLD